MKVRLMSLLVILALCLSLVPVLAGPVQVSAMDTLTVSYTATSFQPGNWRPITLASGDEVIQFTRDNLTVGAGATGWVSFGGWSGTISGGLSGSATMESTSLLTTWSALPSGTGKGYGVNKVTFDDGQGNTVDAIQVSDMDYATSGQVRTYSGPTYFISVSGTGTFANRKLIGSGTGTFTEVNGVPTSLTATATFRQYTTDELVPVSISATGTATSGNFRSLGSGTGSQPNDEFLQVRRSNILTAPNAPAYYGEGGIGTLNGSGAFYEGTIAQDWNMIQIQGTTPPYQGLTLGKWTAIDASGTATVVFVQDFHGVDGSGNGSGSGYSFPTSATGQYAGKDGFGSYTYTTTAAGNWTVSGSLQLSGPAAVTAATNVGAAYFDPPSGLSVEYLKAISESAVSPTGKPNLVFPFGLFEFEVPVTSPGDTVTLTITLPTNVPTNAEYWKWSATDGWYQIPFGSNDGDNVITITLTDGGTGDDDGVADGVIRDQGGPGWPGPSGGGGGSGVPVFPSLYIGIAAALAAGILAYFLRRRLTVHN